MNTSILSDVILAITQQRSVPGVLQSIVDGIVDAARVAAKVERQRLAEIALVRIWLIAPGDQCGSCRFRPECPQQDRCLHLAASAGTPRSGGDDWNAVGGQFRRIPLGIRKVGLIAKVGAAIVVPDFASESEWVVHPQWATSEEVVSFAGYPLVFRGEILGVLGTFGRIPFATHHLAALENFAAHASVAIANARAFEEIERLGTLLDQENRYLRDEVTEVLGMGPFVGRSPGLDHIMRQIRLVAPTDASVLVTGESGTGKEHVARTIHELSPRKKRALIKVNCAAIPEGLFESEFFGHARGAFSGAVADRLGRFELADGGTLFLDEIGEIPVAMQAKLLRALQEQEFERVGEARTRRVDVRIVAATNRDLWQEVQAGRFRQDLYYRLNVFPLEVPPLRDRPDDILPLARHFAALYAKRTSRPPQPIDPEGQDALERYAWPGNVRELQNVVERATILTPHGPLRFDLPDAPQPVPAVSGTTGSPKTEAPITRDALKQLERRAIEDVLARSGGKVFGPSGAAALLGMKPTTLASRIKVLGIERKGRSGRGAGRR